MWNLKDHRATATEVAQRFVAESFEGARFIEGGRIAGNWNGKEFTGSFKLENGTRTYRITCDAGGLWEVRVRS